MESRIISTVNLKGGVGKTTIIQNLGAGLYSKGKTVLYIDLDIQRNLTLALNGKPGYKTIYDALKRGSVDGTIQRTSEGDLIAGDLRIMQLKNIESDSLKRLLDGLEYDYILIDTPPRFDEFINSSLIASDEIIIPVETNLFSYQGLSSEVQLIESVRRLNSDLKIKAVIVNNYDSRSKRNQKFCEGFKKKAEQMGAGFYIIRKNIAISKAQDNQESVFSYEPKSKGAEDFRIIVEDFYE